VLAPTGSGYGVKVTRNGTVLGTFTATNGTVAIYGDGGADLVKLIGLSASANTFTLSGNTATFTAAAIKPDVFSVTLNSITTVTLQGGTKGNAFTNTAATVASVLVGGSTGTNIFTFGGTGLGAVATIQGGGSTNTLTAPNEPNTWTISGSGAGNLNGSNWGFTDIQNLVGGNQTNDFVFGSSGKITGSLNGGGGGTLDESHYTSAITVNLQTSKATGIGTAFSNVQTFLGGTGSNTLVGPNVADTFAITGHNSGTVNSTVSFTGFGSLTGGTQTSDFVFANGVSISGSLNSGGGGTLDLSQYTTAVSLNLATHKATGVGGTAMNLVAVLGGSGTNSLTGANAANTWDLTGSNTGTINGTFAFTAIANLAGGTAGNDFVFSDGKGVTGKITGGGSSGNELDYSAYSTGIYVNLHSGVATGTGGISKIEQVHGGSGNDILVGYGSGILLEESAGDNLIVGGPSQATLQSGSGQDLVIAGSTSYDTNATALKAIEAYWSNASIAETTRYNTLSGSGITGGYKLTPATVKHAAAGDTIALGSGNDWLFWRQIGSSNLDSVTGTPEFSTFI
jgi:hypothetical protein